MDTDRNIQNQIDETLNVFDNMETVNVSPFFKDKTMHVLFAEKEVEQTGWSWFTPKLQLATLVCVVVLNVIAFTKLEETSSYDENLSEFAESYGLLTSDEDTSILNN
ncbi:hypothetical protein DIS18_01130 [Algibacter marinivivus]|uniref:Uncharacterized protein n=1 Tax=Algibacter marinivivus TaxID=2100723 RepID=A0A2U2X5W4_9FLAO|nr:hypothetical protein [Algibacter marinivivus]PWH83185.1 hypothetical protein DIS18_01130 [Algibacter marinivivus]